MRRQEFDRLGNEIVQVELLPLKGSLGDKAAQAPNDFASPSIVTPDIGKNLLHFAEVG